MKLKTLIASTMLAGALIGCGGGSTGDTGGTNPGAGDPSVEFTPYPDAPDISTSDKQEFLDAVNEQRTNGRYCGDVWYPPVGALVWDDHLYLAAAEHSYDMASVNTLSHDGSNTDSDWTAKVLELDHGSSVMERTANNGFNGAAGENIQYTTWYETPRESVEGIFTSEPHCINFMDGGYTTMAGALYNNGARYFTTVNMGAEW